MSSESLGRIFQAGGINQIELLYDKVKQVDLLKPVSSGPYSLTPSVQTTRPVLTIFDATLNLSASAAATIKVGDPSTKPYLFDDASNDGAQGSSLVMLALDASLTVPTAKPSTAAGPLQISGSVAAQAAIAYVHVLPVDPAGTRLQALIDLARRTQLPQLVSFGSLMPGEAMKLSAMLQLDLGLKAQYGRTFDPSIVLNVFEGLSTSLQAHVQASIEASLGWSIYERFELIVAGPSAASLHGDWARVHLAREHRNSLTLGAALALHVDYDAATALTAILDRALQLSPVPDLLEVLRKIDEAFKPAAAADWNAVKGQITGALDEALTAYAGPVWKQWVNGSPEVQALTQAASKVVTFYDEATTTLDQKAKSLWEDLLVKVDLGPQSKARAIIDRIAAIDPAHVDIKQFLTPQWQDALEMLETLAGKDVEELVVGQSAEVGKAIENAVRIAKKLKDFIDNTPDNFQKKVQTMLKTFGIDSAVSWLRANATSKQQLENAGLAWLQRLVERLVGKEWERIDDDDLKIVQKWAAKMSALLGTPQDLLTKLKTAVASMKGDFGLSLSIEMSRVTETVAVLDVELNTQNSDIRNNVAGPLRSGNVQQVLQSLLRIEPDAGGLLPFQIRECLFTTRQLRTSSLALLLPFIGLTKISQTRVEEVTISTDNVSRSAKYLGGATQSYYEGAVKSEGAAFIRVDAAASTPAPAAVYDSISQSLHLTFTREDDETDNGEIAAIEALLADLGFLTGGAHVAGPPDKAKTRFAAEVVLSGHAVDALVKELDEPVAEANWNRDARNAARRWFRDGFVWTTLATFGSRLGDVLAEIVETPLFGTTWTDFDRFVSAASNQPYKAGPNKRRVDFDVHIRNFAPPFATISLMINRRAGRYREIAGFDTALSSARQRHSPENMAALNRAAARLFATSGDEWNVPLFNLWLVLARISRLDAGALGDAEGLATLRWQSVPGGPYDQVTSWTLASGIPTDLAANGTFPL